MYLPNLVIAGAPKCGTSSLFRWLSDHPDVLGSTVKETYYFVDEGTHSYNASSHFSLGGLAGYRAFFPSAPKSTRLVVEATPAYLYSSLALQELPDLETRPHFIFLVREPTAQLRSLYSYFKNNWNWIPRTMGFSAFVSASDSGLDLFSGNELAFHATRNASYVEFLRRWRARCGAGRVHVFLFEQMVADKRSFMREISSRFGIDPDFYDNYDFPKENVTYEVRSSKLQNLNIAVRSLVPRGPIYKGLRSVYRRLNTRPTALLPDFDDHEYNRALARRYEIANRELSDEFGLDLSCWIREQSRERVRAASVDR